MCIDSLCWYGWENCKTFKTSYSVFVPSKNYCYVTRNKVWNMLLLPVSWWESQGSQWQHIMICTDSVHIYKTWCAARAHPGHTETMSRSALLLLATHTLLKETMKDANNVLCFVTPISMCSFRSLWIT